MSFILLIGDVDTGGVRPFALLASPDDILRAGVW